LIITLNDGIDWRKSVLKLMNQQDLEDFTNGCCFFGTGGGGNPEFGQKMLRDALDAGKEIKVGVLCPNPTKFTNPQLIEI